MTLVRDQWNWANRYKIQVEAILRTYAPYLIDIRLATFSEDYFQATDFVAEISGGSTIAVRIRNDNSCRGNRDLTLRHYTSQAVPNEEDKILAGWAKFYLYCWVDSKDLLNEWIFVDLDKLRKDWTQLEVSSSVIQNHDGRTAFRAISAETLDRHGCVIDWHKPQLSLFR